LLLLDVDERIVCGNVCDQISAFFDVFLDTAVEDVTVDG